MKKHVREVIVVEGRYDKNTVSQAVDASIIETNGFGVFSDGEKISLLRRLADERGLIILTDSDRAGFFIRGKLKNVLGCDGIRNAYIPDVSGREKRKTHDSKDGLLGVEGMKYDVIIDALIKAGATFDDEVPEHRDEITKTDMFEFGLSGGPNSSEKRAELQKKLGLPSNMTANGLLEVLNVLYTKKEFEAFFE